jgi:hypothetical protein
MTVTCTHARDVRNGIYATTLSVLLVGRIFAFYVASGGTTTVGRCTVIPVDKRVNSLH